MSRNGLATARRSGERSRFTVTLDNDVFNSINQAGLQAGRGFSGEAEYRLKQSLLDDPEQPKSERRDREDAAARTLATLGQYVGSAFFVGVALAASQRGRSLAWALQDDIALNEGLATAARALWREVIPEKEMVLLRDILLASLPDR